MSSQGLAFVTINNYVSGVNLLHKLNGGDDLREDFGVGLMVKGLKRILGCVSHPKDPLLPEDLVTIFQYVDLSSQVEVSVWIGVLMCFRTMIRKCHLFPTRESDIHLLVRRDVEVKEWGFILKVPTSKTNQYRQRDFFSPVTECESDLCLVRQLRLYWSRMELGEDVPIICRPDGSPIFYDVALKILKKWCNMAKIDKDAGFHSLRRGAATYMSMKGVSLHDIRMEGDWQSMAVLLYLASPMEHRKEIDQFISSSFP